MCNRNQVSISGTETKVKFWYMYQSRNFFKEIFKIFSCLPCLRELAWRLSGCLVVSIGIESQNQDLITVPVGRLATIRPLKAFFPPTTLHILLSLVYFQSVQGESNGPTAELSQRKMNRNEFKLSGRDLSF